MPSVSEARTCELSRRILDIESLSQLLDIFGAEVDALGCADGYLFNLLESGGKHLVSQKLRFMTEFQNLEQTYLGYRHPLDGEFLNARVFGSRRAMRLNEDNANDAEKFVLHNWKVEEIAGVPLHDPAHPEHAPVGVLILLRQKGSFSDDELSRVAQLAAVLHRSLAHWLRFSQLEEMQAQADAAVAENHRLLEFLDEMSSLTSVDKIFELFARELFRQIPFDISGFSLVEGAQLRTCKTIAANPSYQELAEQWGRYMADNPYPLDPTISGAVYVLTRNERMIFHDIQEIMHLPMAKHDAGTISILKTARTLFISPIRYHRQAIGIFAFYSLTEPVALKEADLHLLEQLSSFLGTAVTNGRIYATSQAQNQEIGRLNLELQDKVRELDGLASTDRLTGLFNYRIFETELAKRLNESSRAAGAADLSLALIDIDHFKAFNDNHGHSAGNAVLAGVAGELLKLIRHSDTACRYGGEEFVLILPKCDQAGVALLAERIRQSIEAARFATDAGGLGVTVSVGCAVHKEGESAQEFFARADRALYQAKHDGRNRVAHG